MAIDNISTKQKLQWVVSLGLFVPLGWLLYFVFNFLLDLSILNIFILLFGGVFGFLLVEGSQLAYKFWIAMGSGYAALLLVAGFVAQESAVHLEVVVAFFASGAFVGLNCLFTATDPDIRAYIRKGVKTENQLELEELIDDIGKKQENE